MSSGFLAHRATALPERMDDPACDPAKLHRTYARFRFINRFVSGWGRIYSRYIRPQLRAGARSIVDVGAGGGDIPLMLSRRAAADGFRVHCTAIDTDERAVRFMQSSLAGTSIDVRHDSAAGLLAAGERFDIVLSNNVLHHIAEQGIAAFCADTHALATRLTVHNDIRREALAFLGFLPAHVLFPGSFIAEDGLISIRKSYRCAELRALLSPEWDVQQVAPFRNLCVRRT